MRPLLAAFADEFEKIAIAVQVSPSARTTAAAHQRLLSGEGSFGGMLAGKLVKPPTPKGSYLGAALKRGVTKLAFNWHGFREGIADEGIPLAGATVGAGLGGIRGAALGYAAGGGVSLLRSKLKGEKPSAARKLLAAGALGFGAGGLAHSGLGGLAKRRGGATMKKLFNTSNTAHSTGLQHAVEEGLPAAGATLATGIASGTEKKNKPAA